MRYEWIVLALLVISAGCAGFSPEPPSATPLTNTHSTVETSTSPTASNETPKPVCNVSDTVTDSPKELPSFPENASKSEYERIATEFEKSLSYNHAIDGDGVTNVTVATVGPTGVFTSEGILVIQFELSVGIEHESSIEDHRYWVRYYISDESVVRSRTDNPNVDPTRSDGTTVSCFE